jgi:hypothetical protein
LLMLALAVIGFGVWIIACRRLPSWVKGPLRWPLGDVVTPRIAVIVGWASAIAGVGLVIVTSAVRTSPSQLGFDLTVGASVLAVISSVLMAWSTVQSRKPQNASSIR